MHIPLDYKAILILRVDLYILIYVYACIVPNHQRSSFMYPFQNYFLKVLKNVILKSYQVCSPALFTVVTLLYIRIFKLIWALGQDQDMHWFNTSLCNFFTQS